jgi:hypothetical protein
MREVVVGKLKVNVGRWAVIITREGEPHFAFDTSDVEGCG